MLLFCPKILLSTKRLQVINIIFSEKMTAQKLKAKQTRQKLQSYEAAACAAQPKNISAPSKVISPICANLHKCNGKYLV